MSKRLQHAAGPANMKANYLAPVLNEEGRAELKMHKGFTGYDGWYYHPTRGFKKMSGFKAHNFQSISAVNIEKEKAINSELKELLSIDNTSNELSTLSSK